MSKKDKLNIVYEDKNYIVVDEPSGLLTVSTEKEKENTLFHKVLTYLKQKNKNNKVFIVHRLDKETSGLVLFVKNEKLKNLLQKDWDNLVKLREYIAIVEGKPREKEECLKNYLVEDKTLKVHETKNNKIGKLAITKYKVITSIDKYSLLRIEIKTGRKNQIRVQLSNIGNPIIGDKKYNSKSNPIHRMGLHANKLIIINPITKKEMIFETDVPNDFLRLFNI